MSIKTMTTCDVCEIVKKGGNHWWKCWIFEGEFRSTPSEATFQDDNVKDVCGKQHAIEMYNRYLETGQLDKPVSQPSEEED